MYAGREEWQSRVPDGGGGRGPTGQRYPGLPESAPDHRPVPETPAGGLDHLWRPGAGHHREPDVLPAPGPLSAGPWAQEHDVARLLDLDPAWLEDDHVAPLAQTAGRADPADYAGGAGSHPAGAPGTPLGPGPRAIAAWPEPERQDNPYPTAQALLRAFADYALVLVVHSRGEAEVHYLELRLVQQQVWDIMGLAPLPGQTLSAG